MIVDIMSYPRNPKMVKRLIYVSGYIPGKLFDKANDKIIPIKISKDRQSELLQSSADDWEITLWLEGKKYHTRITKVHMDDTQRFVKEVELELIE